VTAPGWLLRFDARANVLEVEAPGGNVARDENAGLTAVAAGLAEAAQVLAEYRRNGKLGSPRGPAAVAVHDGRSGKLHVARDRTGLHPLFQARSAVHLIGTDARALVAEPSVLVEPSRTAAACWLLGVPLRPAETLLLGLERIPAGHVLEIGAGEFVLRRDWQPPAPGSFPATAASEFGERLEAAIARHSEADHAAVYLSGGIDSSAVAAAATEVARGRQAALPLALTVDFEHASEKETQQLVARGLGLRELSAPAIAAAELFSQALERVGRSLWPTPALWAPVFDGLALRARSDGARLLLDGQGGDDLLDASLSAGRELLLRPRAFRDWLEAERRYVGSAWPSLRAVAGSFRPRPAPTLPAWLAKDPELRSDLAQRLASRPRRYAEVRAADVLDAVLAAQREEAFDRARSLGMEHAHPLWDDGVVELLDGLSPGALVANGDPKSPARAYLRARLQTPSGPWPRPAVADALMRSTLAKAAAAVPARMDEIPLLAELGVVEHGTTAGAFPSEAIWSIVSLESWLRGWGGDRWT
jgi:asparagine synthetase B (glutamine-hydrolysing)